MQPPARRPDVSLYRLGTEPVFFDRWLTLWRETADELFAPAVAERFRDKAERIAESLKLALFFRPGTIRASA